MSDALHFPFIHLASSSPRRRELLGQLGIDFDTVTVAVDESVCEGETPEEYVLRLAIAKANAGIDRLAESRALVLGADTTVILDGRILGKPRDAAHARRMLDSLSNRRHQVLSAIALAGRVEAHAVQRSEVWFRAITNDERDAYVDSGEPMDKAGAYAIQGRGALFVRRLEGSYSAVMGLPLFELGELLKRTTTRD